MNATSLDNLHLLCDEYDEDLPLLDCLYLIAAHEDPFFNLEQCKADLDALRQAIYLPHLDSPIDCVSRINQHLFHERNFRGNSKDYYNPHNSLLHKVLQSETGLPILLSAIYIEIACSLHFPVVGIGFPMHFIIRPEQYGEKLFFIDPFQQGKTLCQSDLKRFLQQNQIAIPFSEAIQPISNRKIIQRICNNLFHAHKKRYDLKGVLRALQLLEILSPTCTDIHRMKAFVLGSLGRFQEAIQSMENYIHRSPNAKDIEECKTHISLLKANCTRPKKL